jgi:hypothetical protein
VQQIIRAKTNMSWSAQTDFETVCKRAAGRRRYNAERRAKARERFKIVIQLTVPPEGRKRGTQARLARALGVHRSTICRDVANWKRLLLEVMDHHQRLHAESQIDTDPVEVINISTSDYYQ